jgi:hypothetical protein
MTCPHCESTPTIERPDRTALVIVGFVAARVKGTSSWRSTTHAEEPDNAGEAWQMLGQLGGHESST